MENQLVNIMVNILAILIPALIAIAIELLRRKLGLESLKKVDAELKTKQEFAMLAIKFVEQAYSELHGEKKANEAIKWMSDRLKENNINVSENEVKGLLESALRITKDSLGENWVNVIK